MNSTETHEVLAQNPQLRKTFLRKKAKGKTRREEDNPTHKPDAVSKEIVRISAQDGL